MVRFFNGKVLFFEPEVRLAEAEVWTDGGTIAYVGPSGKIPEQPFSREIDLEGDVLMPGFKNAHAHTAMTFLRSLADDEPLDSWYHDTVFPTEGKLTEESLYWFARVGIMEYISGGITSAFDMYYYRDAFVKACDDTSFRSVICGGMNDYDDDPTFLERDFERYNSLSPLVSYIPGIHGEYTTCLDRIRYAVSVARKYRTPAFCHLSETEGEVEGCYSRYGKSPVQVLYEEGLFEYGGGGFHFVHVSDDDIKIFSDNGLNAISCPGSNLKLASGIAPLEKLVSAGVRVSLGTDGAASNNALDMFREMYLATALQKVTTKDASALPAQDVLKMACVNGARAMGLSDCDGVAEGKKADLIVLSLKKPNMQPENNIIKNIVYSGNPGNVRLTMINGNILYEDGRYSMLETPETVYANAMKYVEEMKG